MAEENILDLEAIFGAIFAETSPREGKIEPGETTLYHTVTGEAVTFSNYQVKAVLTKRHNDRNYPELRGKPVFTRTPVKTYIPGNMKCLLHRDQPERAEYDRRGYPVCGTGHIFTEFELQRHMEKRHPSTWRAVQFDKRQQEEAESRAFQREQLNAMRSLAENQAALKTPSKAS